MVYRLYVEKKSGLDLEAKALLNDIRSCLGIGSVERVRLLNRYDAEGLSEELFDIASRNVFSEPPVDDTYSDFTPDTPYCFAVEYLPGQFDQRADSAAQCIQLISMGERPTIRTARIWLIYGTLTDEQFSLIKHHVINPVESREASLDKVASLAREQVNPSKVPVLEGFISYTHDQLADAVKSFGLAMDIDDITFLQKYFADEHRDPTLTELRVLDTYWSDHCRHTTFLTAIDGVSIEDPLVKEAYIRYLAVRHELGRDSKPVTLMDLATIGCRYLKSKGMLPKLDESEEINACTVKMTVDVDGHDEDWLLLFKNETHNHPTEIEPFGGAATCIGGAIRDPLSGRSYVYAAMRVTGAADPLKSLADTIPGKLPQKKLTTTAAAGYSSYGNQIGLATGIVDELYHPGYAAKRMEIGAVIAAAPACNVRREVPAPGDRVILIGGRTGRDGCGGATGSSKSHSHDSLATCGAEVQKGNAPEERKLQRLFRNPEASALIKRCNDFGAGGVSVAIGELADGLSIDLNLVPKKYAGLDGTELAISESQERMAVVVEASDLDRFLALCRAENLEATAVATVTEEPRLVMRWNGDVIVDISRDFLGSNGAPKHTSIKVTASSLMTSGFESDGEFSDRMMTLVSDLNVCSKQGLSERFDSTIGAGTVLMPFGGREQLTPIQAMVNKISVEQGHTDMCSFMAWGCNPYLTSASPYRGGYTAVVESVCKLIATGASFNDVYLTFQEYFEKPDHDPARYGKPFSALLGALSAQLDLGIAAIGGKDSMSGSFEKLDVPPTLCSFAVTTDPVSRVVSPEFKLPSSPVYLIRPAYVDGLPDTASLKKCFKYIEQLNDEDAILSMYTPGFGGIAEAVYKMSLGNSLGFEFDHSYSCDDLFAYNYGCFIVEASRDLDAAPSFVKLLGYTSLKNTFTLGSSSVSGAELLKAYQGKLEPVFATRPSNDERSSCDAFSFENRSEDRNTAPIIIGEHSRPRFLIPVFPGTNCEYDSAKAVRDAGGDADIFVIRNLSSADITDSVNSFADHIAASNAIFIPGGFSGADEPDGSAKFITAFFRNERIRLAVDELMDSRDGLMCGICNGFQALIKLGLLPYGHITEPESSSATLTFNTIGRHQSRLVRTRIASDLSPWLAETRVGDVFTVPVSHGEGRFLADDALVKELASKGQIATQYVDLSGTPTMDILHNPNGSVYAIEGITSPDGRILGKMGHSERIGSGLYRNVEGMYDNGMFRSAVRYFLR